MPLTKHDNSALEEQYPSLLHPTALDQNRLCNDLSPKRGQVTCFDGRRKRRRLAPQAQSATDISLADPPPVSNTIEPRQAPPSDTVRLLDCGSISESRPACKAIHWKGNDINVFGDPITHISLTSLCALFGGETKAEHVLKHASFSWMIIKDSVHDGHYMSNKDAHILCESMKWDANSLLASLGGYANEVVGVPTVTSEKGRSLAVCKGSEEPKGGTRIDDTGYYDPDSGLTSLSFREFANAGQRLSDAGSPLSTPFPDFPLDAPDQLFNEIFKGSIAGLDNE